MLDINEIFGPTKQGEGRTAGKDTFFVRLCFCNMHCRWCDSAHTWNYENVESDNPNKFCMVDEVHPMSVEKVIQKLEELDEDGIRSVVITGGEPTLQQAELIDLTTQLKEKGWYIELESNATLIPKKQLFDNVDQFNLSPKLSNSSRPKLIRICEETLSFYANAGDKVTFKFVVEKEEDLNEIIPLVEKFNLQNVYLMPLGATKEELKKTTEFVEKASKRLGVNFSDRLHIILWGGGRGV